MSTIALVDYGSGNIHSAERALSQAARAAGTSHAIQVTADPETLRLADRIVLPGVGHFADCMAGVSAREGLREALIEAVMVRTVPFLGICVGMQLMADIGREDGATAGFGWIGGEVTGIAPQGGLRVPHMGWNEVRPTGAHPVLAGLGETPHAYFVHSYAFRAADAGDVAARTDYGGEITAAVARNNLFGTQFHPEKSQRVGLKLLENFILWTPA